MFLVTFDPKRENMYQVLTFYHSMFRWLVLIVLLYAVCRAARGYYSNAIFSKTDNALRHWTATICHLQLTLGIILYTKSPIVNYYWAHLKDAGRELVFFGVIHLLMMLAAIVFITIGSAKAKRMPTDRQKFKTMLVWYSIGLLIILMAIPWPFSPLASRPYFR